MTMSRERATLLPAYVCWRSPTLFRTRVTMSIWTHEESVVREAFSEKAAILGLPEGSLRPQVALLDRLLDLPFPPFPGLSLVEDEWSCHPRQTVTWSQGEQCFSCRVEDEYPRFAFDSYLSFDDLLRMSLEAGWERPLRGGGDAPRVDLVTAR
jgi:hypothetical protein